MVLHNNKTEPNNDTTKITGILSFKSVLFLSNACRIFNFVQSDSLSFYSNTILTGLNAIHETK